MIDTSIGVGETEPQHYPVLCLLVWQSSLQNLDWRSKSIDQAFKMFEALAGAISEDEAQSSCGFSISLKGSLLSLQGRNRKELLDLFYEKARDIRNWELLI